MSTLSLSNKHFILATDLLCNKRRIEGLVPFKAGVEWVANFRLLLVAPDVINDNEKGAVGCALVMVPKFTSHTSWKTIM
jgi:hypothetical protein